LSQPLSQTNTV